ncbi:DUF1801 domain-containing protein [Microscilla marina]|uniref:YdhG-like domain-containing protein n=1 Tax=Microscilla marina ATCC 23134 TaxID=313606 RepID=A1ZU74_MICM2|nr:DUF1801 domain-containing protein [Microscilla marina]EAY26045.1 conserved hypothetical protein [Microscilla marina ATCC 23134]
MATLKTKPNDQSVEAYIENIADEKRRTDCKTIAELMEAISGQLPVMWSDSIVGFGSYHYKYASGREGDWFLTGFASRKQSLTLYIMAGFDQYDELMEQLGKYKTGKSCLYIKKLEDIDQDVLKKLIKASILYLKKQY